MDPTVNEWLNLVIRWIHVITGIAWVGASFYFNWLLIRLTPSEENDPEVAGELWAIHAGGFFRVQKRRIAPGRLPDSLHWFKWEAYWTWISGFMLLVLVYYVGAGVYLVDPNVSDIGEGAAIAIGLGTLFGGWLVYDWLWRSDLGSNRDITTVISCLLVAGFAYGLSQVLSPRAAYIHVGAMLGTFMVGNVLRVIMPSQRQLVASTVEGREPDERLSAEAELRSLHNNYLTLPVLFIMVSAHYPSTYGHEHGWVVLLGLSAVGVLVRHYFNIRHHAGDWPGAWMLVVAVLLACALAWWVAPRAPASVADSPGVALSEIREIFDRRCVSCHAAKPTQPGFAAPPKGVAFDTAQEIKAKIELINVQTVLTTVMPLANLTRMTREEREVLGRWIRDGAQVE